MRNDAHRTVHIQSPLSLLPQRHIQLTHLLLLDHRQLRLPPLLPLTPPLRLRLLHPPPNLPQHTRQPATTPQFLETLGITHNRLVTDHDEWVVGEWEGEAVEDGGENGTVGSGVAWDEGRVAGWTVQRFELA